MSNLNNSGPAEDVYTLERVHSDYGVDVTDTSMYAFDFISNHDYEHFLALGSEHDLKHRVEQYKLKFVGII